MVEYFQCVTLVHFIGVVHFVLCVGQVTILDQGKVMIVVSKVGLFNLIDSLISLL